jgi:hypothetical protein
VTADEHDPAHHQQPQRLPAGVAHRVDAVGGVVDRVASLEGVRDAVGNDLAAAVQHVVDLLAVVAVCRRAAAGVDLDDPMIGDRVGKPVSG